MSQQFVPPTEGRLVDGRVLRVEQDGVHVGERFHPLARIQEARLLFLRPETISLSTADVGVVEYSFARQGDGVAALDALYTLRPDVRRADAPAPLPEAPAGYLAPVAAPQPLTPQPEAHLPPGAAGQPYGVQRPGYPPAPLAPQFTRPLAPALFPPQALDAYGPEPNRTRAELTPVPRSVWQLIGSAFRLFGKRLGALLSLALLVATLPSIVSALLDALVSALSGINPLAGAPNPVDTLRQAASGQTVTTTTPTPTTPTSLDFIISLLSLAAVALPLLVAAWSQASLTIGARQATLGRSISVRECAREGLMRLWPTLWALFVLYGLLGVIAIPGFGLALALVLAPSTPGANAQITPQDAVGFSIVAVLVAVATTLAVAYLWTRFAFYPTAAALGMAQPLRVSLALTSFGWWRVFWALFVVTAATSLLTVPVSATQLLSVALATVALSPLAQLITGPLSALIRVVILYDQRLRREGYALFLQEGIAMPPAAPLTATPERTPEVGG